MALFTKSIVCRQAVELMTDYLEGALGSKDRARLEKHLARCPHCHEYLAEMRTTVSLLGTLDPGALPGHVQHELNDVYQRWLSEKN